MKDFLRSVIIVIIIICGIAVYFGHYMLNVAVRPESDRRHQLDSCYARVYNKYPELQIWHDSLVAKGNLRDTFLLADDGTKRHGLTVKWYLARASRLRRQCRRHDAIFLYAL